MPHNPAPVPDVLTVYFSSTTENTHRMVGKLGTRSARIPLRATDPALHVDEPFVLITPTYGGGAGMVGEYSRPVPKQVIRFLNDPDNRRHLRGVIAAGNLNFGSDFCKAGEIIAAKCQVPYLYRFELMGTPEDVTRIREGLAEFRRSCEDEGVWWAEGDAASPSVASLHDSP